MNHATPSNPSIPPSDAPSGRPDAESAPDQPGEVSPGAHPSSTTPATGGRRRRRGVRPSAFLDVLSSDARSRPWIDAVRRRFGDEAVNAAYQAALQGAVLSVMFEDREAVVEVSNERRRPFRVRVSLRPWTSGEESHVVELLTNRAALVTELLGGAWSEEATIALGALGSPLGPLEDEEASARCDCPWARPCLHIPLALVVLADLARTRPGGFFAMRGLPLESLLERVRRNRAMRSQGMVAAHPEASFGLDRVTPLPLEQEIDHFWSRSGQASPDAVEPVARPVSHALLRRMGPSPLRGRFPIVGLLASIYDEVSRRTREISERLSPPDEAADAGASSMDDSPET
ncbi:MAG: hypothetical protein HRU76_16130 [Phycisphaeraceae bacterium]|nr:MAG: hypothetical protein HRU76_16130 [Phycisphaeraceae bacterium]